MLIRRTILAALATATLLAPSLALAKSAVGLPEDNLRSAPPRIDPFRGSLGNGMNNRSNGDVTGPGRGARVDDSTKGPMDDLHPGNPFSDDVPSSAHPRPVR